MVFLKPKFPPSQVARELARHDLERGGLKQKRIPGAELARTGVIAKTGFRAWLRRQAANLERLVAGRKRQ